jgi:chromosome segregation ATPase
LPPKSRSVPATCGFVWELNQELKQEITSFRLQVDSRFKKTEVKFKRISGQFKRIDSRFNKVDGHFKRIDARFKKIDARFNEVDARFKEVDARFNEVDARFDEMDARFNKMDARFDQLSSQILGLTATVHRAVALAEEQNARNLIVLDGYAQIYGRQQLIESRTGRLEERVFGIKE